MKDFKIGNKNRKMTIYRYRYIYILNTKQYATKCTLLAVQGNLENWYTAYILPTKVFLCANFLWLSTQTSSKICSITPR